MKFAWIAEPPFNFHRDGDVTGCDVELARRAFSALGEVFEPVETEFAELLPGLERGRWDVTTAMFITSERSGRAHFTIPVWSLRDGLLVRDENASRVDGYRSIAGGTLAVLEGQVQRETAVRLGVPEAAILTFKDYDDAARAVANGEVIAYASVELAHLAHVAAHPARGLACVAVPEEEKPADAGAFACRTAEIRDRLNPVLLDMLGTAAHCEC